MLCYAMRCYAMLCYAMLCRRGGRTLPPVNDAAVKIRAAEESWRSFLCSSVCAEHALALREHKRARRVNACCEAAGGVLCRRRVPRLCVCVRRRVPRRCRGGTRFVCTRV